MKTTLAALALAILMAAPTGAQVAAGAMAPDLSIDACRNIEGAIDKLSDLRGAAVLLEFCATWCGPCRAQIPHLNELQKSHAEEGLVVLGVTNEGLDKIDPWIKANAVSYPIAVDANGRGMKAYGVRGIPTAFLIDPDGRVVWSGHPAQLAAAEIGKAVTGAVSPFVKLRDQLAPVQDLLDLRQKGRAMAMLQLLQRSGKLDGKVKELTAAALTRLEREATSALQRAAALRAAKSCFAAAVVLHGVAASFEGAKPAADAQRELGELGTEEVSKHVCEVAGIVAKASALVRAGKYAAARQQYQRAAASDVREAQELAAQAIAELESRELRGFHADCAACVAAGKPCERHEQK